MKVRKSFVIASAIVIIVLVTYSMVMRKAYYRVARENMILKDSLHRAGNELIRLRSLQR